MILEDARGAPLADIEPGLSDHQRSALYKHFGSITRKLHDINGNYFGYPHVPELQGESWPNVFLKMIEIAIEDIARLNGDIPKIVQEFGPQAVQFQGLVQDNARPSLIHWDLTGHNVFVDAATMKVSAIIDWERAFWGLPEAEHHWSFAPEAFFTGYGKPRRSDSLARKRQALYVIYVILVMLADAPRRGATSDIRNALDSFISCLNIIHA